MPGENLKLLVCGMLADANPDWRVEPALEHVVKVDSFDCVRRADACIVCLVSEPKWEKALFLQNDTLQRMAFPVI